MEENINFENRKNVIKPLLELIKESMELMESYVNMDSDVHIIMDGMKVGQEIPGPPSYEHVLQTIEATSESEHSFFRQLGSMVPDYISNKEFEKLFNRYEYLRLKCEKFRR